MKKKHIVEIIGLIISLLIALAFYIYSNKDGNTKNNIGVFIGIFSIWIFYAIVVIKIHMNEIRRNIENNINENNEMIKTFFDIKDKYIHFGKKIVDKTIEDLKNVQRGTIPLDEQQYYDHITKKSEELREDDFVLSINTFEERRFIKDKRQKIYLEENIKAINNHKVRFTRIFVIDTKLIDLESSLIKSLKEDQYRKNIKRETADRIRSILDNYHGKIKVIIVDREKLKGTKMLLEDGVLFSFKKSGEEFLYIDEQDPYNKMNVLKGELRLEYEQIAYFKKVFNKLLKFEEKDYIEILENQYNDYITNENIK